MKKLVAALVVLAMVLAMVPAVFAAETSGQWFIGGGETYEWTAPASGSATVTASSGYSLYVTDAADEMLGMAATVTFTVTEGETYKIKNFGSNLDIITWEIAEASDATSGTLEIESYGWIEWTAPATGTVAWSSDCDAQIAVDEGWDHLVVFTGSGSCQVEAGVTYTVAPMSYPETVYVNWEYTEVGEGSGDEGGEDTTVDTTLELGDNEIAIAEGDVDGETFTYVAEQTGTLTVEITALSYDFWGTEQAFDESSWPYFGRQFVLTVNGEQFYENIASVEVTAGDEVSVTLQHNMGNKAWGSMNLSYASEGEEEFTAQVVIPEGSMNSNTYTYVAEQTGTLTIGFANLYQYTILDYETGEAVWEELSGMAMEMALGRGAVNLVVNGEVLYYTTVYEMAVNAGDEVVVGLNSMNGQFAANFTFTVEESSGDEGGEDDSFGELNAAFSGSGTYSDPYIIESIPVDLVFGLTQDATDIYFQYTPVEDGTITCTDSTCDYMWVVGGNYSNGNSLSVTAGEAILINTYGEVGAHSMSLSFEAGSSDTGSDNECDVELPGEIVTEGNEYLSSGEKEMEYFTLSWTAPADGTLYVHMCAADPGWFFGIDGLTGKESGTEETTYEYLVYAGTEYYITIGGYDKATWGDADAQIGWIISYEESEEEHEAVKEDYIIVDVEGTTEDWVITEEGTYTVNMEYADVTIVTFAPLEEGIYTVTVNGQAVIGNYGGTAHYIYSSDSVTHSTSLEWTCQEAPETETDIIQDENWNYIEIIRINDGQGLMIGIKPDSEDVQSVEITIEKTGDYTKTEVEVQTYENKAEISQFELGDLIVGDYVDVYGEDHTAVLGDDGYYHLDSEDGPILLVDMDYLTVLTDALNGGRGIMYAYVMDENGNIVEVYDVASAVRAYEAVCDENGYYPMTEDLLFFYQVYAAGSGVPYYVLEEGFNEQCGWMFACITAEAPATDSGNTEEGKPGDTALAAVIGLMAVSAMGVAIVVSKKKEF